MELLEARALKFTRGLGGTHLEKAYHLKMPFIIVSRILNIKVKMSRFVQRVILHIWENYKELEITKLTSKKWYHVSYKYNIFLDRRKSNNFYFCSFYDSMKVASLISKYRF